MGGKTIDLETRKKIVRYLQTHSQHTTAKHFKISSSTVNKIANKSPAIKKRIEHSRTKNASEARKEYAKIDRLRILNKFMGLIDLALEPGDHTTHDLRNISTALGTALDKYRLEEKDMDDQSKGEASDLLTRVKKGEEG